MKDTNHHIRHPRVHLGHLACAYDRGSWAQRDGENGRGTAPSWAGATPLLHTFPWPKVNRGSLQHNNKIPSVRAARISAKQVKKVGITYFSFVFSIFFSL
jgi:hypothetical protein